MSWLTRMRADEATTGGTVDDGWGVEQSFKRSYDESDGAEVGRRYGGIRDRGREHQRGARL